MAKHNTDKDSTQQKFVKEFLSQDIDLVASDFTDEHAQVIAEDIKQCFNSLSKLAPVFFALFNQGKMGITLIKNFISKYIEDNQNVEDYERLIECLKKLPTIDEIGAEILLFALNLAPTPEHLAYCTNNIIKSAVKTPDLYTLIEPKLLETIKTCPQILHEELNDFFIKQNDREDIQHYIVDRLCFVPITECPFLINEDIEELHPTINYILRKSRCDLVGQDRDNLIANLIEHLNLLLSDDAIALVLKAGSEYTDIYMCAYGVGADSGTTNLDQRNFMTFRGAKNYVNGECIYFATAIVHETTHMCFRRAYNNNAKPYVADDDKTIHIEDLVKKITTTLIDSLKEKALPLESLKALISDSKAGYNEVQLVFAYEESLYSKELPAFFMQELAIRMLSNNPEMRDSILLDNSEALFGIINPMLDIFRDISEDKVPVAGEFSFTDEVA